MKNDVVRSFANGGAHARGVNYAGIPAGSAADARVLEPRGAVHFALGPDELAQIKPAASSIHPVVLAFDDTGADALSSMGLAANRRIGDSDFLSASLCGWIESLVGSHEHSWIGCELPDTDTPSVLRTRKTVEVWVIAPIRDRDLVLGRGSGLSTVVIFRNRGNAPQLPPPLGSIREEFTVPRATAAAYRLHRGEIVQIIDVEGQQCSDFLAFRTAGLAEGLEQMIDGTVTRTQARRAYPAPGLFDTFYDSEFRPLLNLVQDTVGRHDTFALACTARGYEERGFPGHVNCSDNISAAMAPFGVAARPAWPAINLFFNSWIDPSDNLLRTDEGWSRPGDYVAMHAEDDLVCVSTACPDDTSPINGWNPTDVHVRIYSQEAPIRRSVAYREKEDSPPAMTEESAFHPRTSVRTRSFRPLRNVWMPASYSATGAIGEYWACRRAVTLQDMSGLRKYDIKGPDAEALLQTALTRDVAKLPVHRGVYALMCDDTGSVIDDGTLFRLAPEIFRWLCGSEESARALAEVADRSNLRARIEGFRGALPNLSLQGPKSRDVLRKIVFTSDRVPALEELKWFGMTVARLRGREGVPFMLTRTGYTGELGYELFFDRASALEVWDALMEAGEPLGLTPMGTEALEILRIEAGLMAAGAEFAPGIDAIEAGLGFCVDFGKPSFRGREALARNREAQRNRLVGLLLEGQDVPRSGDTVLAGERPAGVVTSATRSPSLERPVAMARVAVEHAELEGTLAVGQLDQRMKRLEAQVVGVPFVDPERKRARS